MRVVGIEERPADLVAGVGCITWFGDVRMHHGSNSTMKVLLVRIKQLIPARA